MNADPMNVGAEPREAEEAVFARLVTLAAKLLKLDAAVVTNAGGETVQVWHAADPTPAWLPAFAARPTPVTGPTVVSGPQLEGPNFLAAAPLGAASSREGALYLLGEDARADAADFEEHLRTFAQLAEHWRAWAAGTREVREAHDNLRGLVDGAPLAMYALTLEGLVKHWNAAAERLLGWRADELIGKPLPPELAGQQLAGRELAGQELAGDAAFGAMREHFLREEARARALRQRRKDGSELDMSLKTGAVRGAGGEVVGIVNVAHDVTEDLSARRAAEQQLRLLESVLAHANDSVLITEAEPFSEPGPRILYANEAFTRTTGYTLQEVLGKTPRILHGPRTDRAAREKIRRALEKWQPVEVELENYRKDGTQFWVELSIAPVADETGWFTHWISIQRDITERKLGEARLDRERNLVLELAAKGAPLHEVLERLVGMVEEQFGAMRGGVFLTRGGQLAQVFAPNLPPAFARGLLSLGTPPSFGGHAPAHLADVAASEAPARHKDHAAAHGLRAAWSWPIFSSRGAALGFFALYGPQAGMPSEAQERLLEAATQLAAVVIERYQAQEELERRALYDALTELPNRVLFRRRLEEALAAARQSGRQVAVGLIDLDRFKVVNDTLGHSAGDKLLQQVAARLGGGMREGDTLARMGGDEFLLVLSDISSPEQVHGVADRLLAALARGFHVAGQEVFVRPSIGFSMFPAQASDPEVLLQQADTAMYRAKGVGGGYTFYSPGGEDGLTPMALESALNHALDRNELVLHYQPLLGAPSGEAVGVEALLRWQHPTLGLVSPAQFIPLAETTGLIVPIGAWVLREACEQAVRWTRLNPELRVAVNLSARQFLQSDLIGLVTRTLAETGLAPHRLELELTESMLMGAPEAAETLRRLKNLGVRIVIDDFGTGYSSLAYLKRFALDALKIDRSFVQDLGVQNLGHAREGQPKDAAIVRAIISLAHGLELEVVAEGVENEAQRAFLREQGCDVLQGYLLGKPRAARDVEAWLGEREVVR